MDIYTNIEISSNLKAEVSSTDDLNTPVWDLLQKKSPRIHYFAKNEKTYYVWLEKPDSSEDWGVFGFWMILHVRCLETETQDQLINEIRRDSWLQQVIIDVINHCVETVNALSTTSPRVKEGFKLLPKDIDNINEIIEQDWKS